MTRSLRIFYVALFMLILTALGIWSMRSFLGFSTNPDATVLNGRWAKAVETHYGWASLAVLVVVPPALCVVVDVDTLLTTE